MADFSGDRYGTVGSTLTPMDENDMAGGDGGAGSSGGRGGSGMAASTVGGIDVVIKRRRTCAPLLDQPSY